MPWVSDEILRLYRETNASMLAIADAMTIMARNIRRIEKRIEEMAKSNQEIIQEVRQIRGFVASLRAAFDALKERVGQTLEKHEVDDEVVAEVDALFNDAKAGADQLAPAITANPTPSDPVPASPSDTPQDTTGSTPPAGAQG